MDANAEVCFLTGADFESLRASDMVRAAGESVTRLFDEARAVNAELTTAKCSHIEKTGRAMDKLREQQCKEQQDVTS